MTVSTCSQVGLLTAQVPMKYAAVYAELAYQISKLLP